MALAAALGTAAGAVARGPSAASEGADGVSCPRANEVPIAAATRARATPKAAASGHRRPGRTGRREVCVEVSDIAEGPEWAEVGATTVPNERVGTHPGPRPA